MSFTQEQLNILALVLKHKGSDVVHILTKEQRDFVDLVISDSRGILINRNVIDAIATQFHNLDRNGDGFLQKDDFIMSNTHSVRVWHQLTHWIDVDGDNIITQNEFLKFYVTFALYGMHTVEESCRGKTCCGDYMIASRQNLNNNILLLLRFIETNVGDPSIDTVIGTSGAPVICMR